MGPMPAGDNGPRRMDTFALRERGAYIMGYSPAASIPQDFFQLHSNVKRVTQMLRARVERSAEARAELLAAIDQLQALWRALQEQSAELAAQRQRFEEFFVYAPDAYVLTDVEGAIRDANRAARDLLGLGEELRPEASLVALVDPAERPSFRGRLVAVRGHPEADTLEWEASFLHEGATRRMKLRVQPVKVRRKNAGALCWLLRASA